MIKAEKIYVNGRFMTMDAARPEAGALAVSSGRIVALGSTSEIESLAGPATERIDMDPIIRWTAALSRPDWRASSDRPSSG